MSNITSSKPLPMVNSSTPPNLIISPLPNANPSPKPFDPKNGKTFIPLLDSCKTHKQFKQVHALTLKTGVDKYPLVLSKILRLCSDLNALDYAAQIFARIENRNIYHYTALIGGNIYSGSSLEAIKLFESMLLENIAPDPLIFSHILKACSLNLELKIGKQVHGQIFKLNMCSERVVKMRLMEFYGKCRQYDNAKLVFEEMPEMDAVASTILITCYSDHGLIEEAKNVFDKVLNRELACWNSLIGGCVKNNKANDALDIFREMQRKKIEPNKLTLVSVLSACSLLGTVDLGKWVHSYITKNKIKINNFLGSALINMYGRCGYPDKAQEVFDEMSETERRVDCYNSLLTGLAMHGRSYQAVELYKQMIDVGMRPNHVTFVGVLNACSHGGLVYIGLEIFESMQRDFNIEPKIEHYGCMVDLLGRVGKLREAYELIQSMKIKPNHIIWGSLLSSCKIHEDLQLAEKVAKYLFESDTADSGTYVILSNVYASFGKWNEAVNLRARMREKGIQKEIGCSSIEINNEIHEFRSGDINHPRRDEIYAKSGELELELRENGYEPNTRVVFQDVEEELKEKALRMHSERLAICLGLISTRDGETLRIVKNLRVCSDCHVAIKIISKMTKREIVVRDRKRFHHFEDGFCSCGDFW